MEWRQQQVLAGWVNSILGFLQIRKYKLATAFPQLHKQIRKESVKLYTAEWSNKSRCETDSTSWNRWNFGLITKCPHNNSWQIWQFCPIGIFGWSPQGQLFFPPQNLQVLLIFLKAPNNFCLATEVKVRVSGRASQGQWDKHVYAVCINDFPLNSYELGVTAAVFQNSV